MNKVLCSYMNFYSFNREYKFLEKPEPPGISAHEDSEIVLQKYIWSFDLKKKTFVFTFSVHKHLQSGCRSLLNLLFKRQQLFVKNTGPPVNFVH